MRELRFVQQAFEGSVLVLEAENGEQFVLPADQVRAGAGPARSAEPARPTPDPRPAREPGAAPLGPREIQMRVRAGESAEELAESSGTPLDRVMRFAIPVLVERSRVTDEARHGRARRAPGEAAKLPFGETVDRRFTAHGIDPASVGWDSHRRDDGQWIVTASWQREDERHTAEWTYTRPGRVVAPVDEAALDLLSDRPVPAAAPARPAAPRLTLAFPPMPEASTAPLREFPEGPELFDQESERPTRDPWHGVESPALPLPMPAEKTHEDGPRTAPRSRTRRATAAARTSEPARAAQAADNREAQAPPAMRAASGDRTPSARAARAGGGRPPVPSWDDILLGVRPDRG